MQEAHPDKKVGIFCRGKSVLSGANVKGQTIMNQLIDRTNVTVHRNQGNFDPDSELAKSYSMVVKCVGSKHNSEYMSHGMEDFVDSKGRIQVNSHYQVTSQSPSETLLFDNSYYNKESRLVPADKVQSGVTIESIFSMGDACITIQDEEKNIPSISGAS